MIRHRVNRTVFPALCLLAALGMIFTGCSTGGDDDDGPASVAVSGVSLNKSTLTLGVADGTETLTATVTPADATNKNVTWTSGNTGVATVSNGVVAAMAAGTTTITVTTEDGGYTAGCTVMVTDYAISLDPPGPFTFLSAIAGYGTQADKSVTVNNTGNQATGALTVALSGAGSSSFTLSTPTISSIAINGNDSFTVVPNTGLAVGTYTAVITVSGGNGISTTFTVSFTVLPAYEMKAVPGGTIAADMTWGSGSNYSLPQTISPFSMGETEITYELWKTVYDWATDSARGANQYTFANPGREGHDGTDGAAPTAARQEPVPSLSWRDAVVWCNAYSEAAGKTPVYKNSGAVLRESEGTGVSAGSGKAENAVLDPVATGFRLPTEAEWEYAARGGNPDTGTPWTYTYAGSNMADSVAVSTENSGSKTATVKSKAANSRGLYDMSGNVWEWCQDMYVGAYRVTRGGGWGFAADNCTVASRSSPHQNAWNSNWGFRVVCP
ncbi:MAG: SUMF1/EgtB/PvdO family nonheme iron enzyme [Spirochaetales bacterium]|jgi:formylglycine-generating enzyme required for sulfatase activity|nr:SUMF1/EgtB/PvdO family nonheme iron enzyme [Spirochaetales bacterium]